MFSSTFQWILQLKFKYIQIQHNEQITVVWNNEMDQCLHILDLISVCFVGYEELQKQRRSEAHDNNAEEVTAQASFGKNWKDK